MREREVEQIIGYTFEDKGLLQTAFTHSSYAKTHGVESNERLEFFGDAILDFVVSEREYKKSKVDEGVMTKARIKQVKDETLKKIVEKLDLDRYLLFDGKREQNLGKKAVPSLFEAVVAAIYLDGGMDEAKKFILDKLPLAASELSVENYTGALKEYLEKRGLTPKEICQRQTPPFSVRVEAMGKWAEGSGKTKKEARNNASKKLYEILLQKEGK